MAAGTSAATATAGAASARTAVACASTERPAGLAVLSASAGTTESTRHGRDGAAFDGHR